MVLMLIGSRLEIDNMVNIVYNLDLHNRFCISRGRPGVEHGDDLPAWCLPSCQWKRGLRFQNADMGGSLKLRH